MTEYEQIKGILLNLKKKSFKRIRAPFLIYILKNTLYTFDHVKYPDILKGINDAIELYRSGCKNKEEFREAAHNAYKAYNAANEAAYNAANAAGSAANAAVFAVDSYNAADYAAKAAVFAAYNANAANAAYAYKNKLIELICSDEC